jgi:Pectate lyase superfamily protein
MPIEDYSTSAASNLLLGAIPVGPNMEREKVNNAFQQLMADIAVFAGPTGGAALLSFLQDGTGATTRTMQSKLRDVVNVKDFGAVGDGVADDTAAIQAALNTGKAVALGTGNYKVTATLRLAADGQTLYGEGKGNFNEPARTKIVWSGASGGKIISISNGTTENWQSVTIRDIYIDANSLALVGIEGYDTTISGGAWRNQFINLTLSGFTVPSSVGISFGTGSFPDFAHDAVVRGCFIINAQTGIAGAGAIYQVSNTTFLGCQNGAVGTAGSTWTFTDCVFSSSVEYDFQGTNIQLANFSGCWFENSLFGIYKATTAHCANFTGCFLQTDSSNTTQLMDMGNAAGNFSLKGCSLGATSGSSLLKNINPTAEYDITTSNVTIEGLHRAKTSGFIRADNGAFAAGLTADALNVTGDGTAYSFNASAWTEDYDTASAFNATTGVFTAPADGYYDFKVQLSLADLGAAHTDYELILTTTNGDHLISRANPGAIRIPSNDLVISGGITVVLLATQTAYIKLRVSNSTKTVDVTSGNAGVNWRTRFEGRMI